MENNTGKPNSEEFEHQVNKYLNQAVNESGKQVLKQLKVKTVEWLIWLIVVLKVLQLIWVKWLRVQGQQNADGKRIPYGFEDHYLIIQNLMMDQKQEDCEKVLLLKV